MKKKTLLRGARQLLTLRGSSGPRRGVGLSDLGVIENGAILIEDGAIAHVGPSARVENLAASQHAEEIDVAGKVVMPGFVDSHTHLLFGVPRLMDYEMRISGADSQKIEAAGGGIAASVNAVRTMTRRSLESQARRALAWMAQSGTTTVEAKSGYGLDESTEMKILRILNVLNGDPLDVVPTFMGAHSIPPEFNGRGEEYIEYLRGEMIPKVARRRLARFADVRCGPGAFSVAQASTYLQAASSHGLMPKVHADQFANTGGTRLAIEIGAVTADHLEHVSSEDIRFLSVSSTIATLLPGSVFYLGLNRYAPARRLIDGGAAVALATGFNPGTSPTCNMGMILSLACTQMRMTPAEAIAAGTFNGAHAVGLGDRIGSLESGKQADIVVLDVSDYREIPYYFGVNLVRMTMKRGKVIYRRD